MRLLLESKVKELEKHERLLKFEMRLRAHQPPAPTTAAAAVEPAVGIVPVAPPLAIPGHFQFVLSLQDLQYILLMLRR